MSAALNFEPADHDAIEFVRPFDIGEMAGVWDFLVAAAWNESGAPDRLSPMEFDPDRLALPLSFLHHYAAAPEPWRARALPARFVEMNRMPKPAVDPRAALRALPPLIKGYLRLGAFVGEGAVIERHRSPQNAAAVGASVPSTCASFWFRSVRN